MSLPKYHHSQRRHGPPTVRQRHPSLSGSSLSLDGFHREGGAYPKQTSVTEKYSLSPSPASWGTPLLMSVPEPDDALHNPDPQRDQKWDAGGSLFSARGIVNLGCLIVLGLGITTLFAGYPLLSHFLEKRQTTRGGFNLGGINATGQVPIIEGSHGLIDPDTPLEAHRKKAYIDGKTDMVLVFSDEFNTPGRTFFPGDDPYWEAVDLHYWQTNDLEWYDPQNAFTEGGYLHLKLTEELPENNHNLSYRSGMIQTWNKFCFTGGIMEVSVSLPGSPRVSGLWPAAWAMGNLGRAGYGASLEGLWPYSYDTCDVGTLPNQTYPGRSAPVAALTTGAEEVDGSLSYLPGQRLSACTCKGESHPGPVRPNGSYVGRAAPEIDVFEASVDGEVGTKEGVVSLSGQWAPYDPSYAWKNTSDNMIINDGQTFLNTYVGGVFQQTTSGIAKTNQNCYELTGGCFSVYAFEYKPGFDDSYITWINDGQQAWTLMQAGLGPNEDTEVGQRLVSREPMYMILNLGFSPNFAVIETTRLRFPATMRVDYVRVYQPENARNIGCDPPEYPTAKYIETYPEAYTNRNFTQWSDYGQVFPKNSMKDDC